MPVFSHHQTMLSRAVMLGLLLTSAFGMQPANGHEYHALIKAKKYAEAERSIGARLALDANNADALVAKTDLILAQARSAHLERLDRLDEALTLAQRCVEHHPNLSQCHEALGSVLGVKAEKGGMMAGISSLGTIRDSLRKAIELDPKNVRAASSLLTFYLEVPGLMGGSHAKAKDLILETRKNSPAAAALFQAQFDLKEENLEKARVGALAVNTATMPAIAQLQHDLLLRIGQGLIKDNKLPDGEKVFREITQRFPDSAPAWLGLGKALQEQGKHKEALPQLEKSLNIDASGAVFYRLGKAWQAVDDKAKAISFFEKALAFTPGLGKKTRADAQEQLKTLK